MSMFPADLKKAKISVFVTNAEGEEFEVSTLLLDVAEQETVDVSAQFKGGVKGASMAYNLLLVAAESLDRAIDEEENK